MKRRRNQNTHYSAENAKKEMQNLQADNQRILQEARLERDNMLKEAREMKEKMLMLKRSASSGAKND
jgi:F-type H+-transporting ATPase subunit b